MFNIKKWRQKLCYAGIACLFVLIGMLFSPIKANQKGLGMSAVECSKVRVVSSLGAERLRLFSAEDGGYLAVWSAREPAKSFWGKQKGKKSLANIGALEHGGAVNVRDEEIPDEPKKMNYLGIGENGGNISIMGHGIGIKEGAGINQYGDGFYRK